MGVDSLYTICKFGDKITHLVVNKFHAINRTSKDDVFEGLKRRAESFAKDVGKELIIGNTNYDEATLPGVMHNYCTTFSNVFAIFALQKLFSQYYLSGEVSFAGFTIKPFSKKGTWKSLDCAYFDLLTLYVYSHETLLFVCEDSTTRLEKIRALADYSLAWKYLNVCHIHKVKDGDVNGTYDCQKCSYTILALLAVGGEDVLNRFAAVFHLDYVKKYKGAYLADLLRGKLRNLEFYRDCWHYRKNMGFTWVHYVVAIRILAKKMARKCLKLFGIKISSSDILDSSI